MSSILPLPTSRVSDSLVRQRLTGQTQSDQLAIFRLQNQISTGRRIFSPSDDPSSALRAITLQRNLERKDQLQINVQSATASLTNASSALATVNTTLIDIRAEAIGVSNTTNTQEQRDAVLKEVDNAIEALLQYSNSTYRDNYLFSGTRGSQAPFEANGSYIEYGGDERDLRSYVDLDYLFDTNLSGQQVFGGISEAVRGSSDLQPQVTSSTFLTQLNDGAGVTPNGSIQIDYIPAGQGGIVSESAVIDLSRAYTVGDVVRAIEEGAPDAADLQVNITGRQLSIEVGGTGNAITISEVGQGRSARELGIGQDIPASSIIGETLDPTIRSTTRLDTLLGTKSQAQLELPGDNNDLVITATANGAAYNGVQIILTDTPAASAGNEVATFDAGAGTLTVQIEPGRSSAKQIAAAINDQVPEFSAETDFRDAVSAIAVGSGVVPEIALGTYNTDSSGSGTSLDLASGLRINNGDGEIVINTAGLETVHDLLGELNRPEYGLVAQINEAGDGLDIRSRRSGANFSIGENGGTLATQLGVRTYDRATRLEDFNRGIGVATETDYELNLALDDGSGNVENVRVNLSNDASATFPALTAGVPSGSLNLKGAFQGTNGDRLSIVFAEDSLTTEHSAALNGNELTVTIGTSDGASGTVATVDLDAVFDSLTDVDFTNNIAYSDGDITGSYTVGSPDATAAITFSGGGDPVTVGDAIDRINTATGGRVTASLASVGNGLELSFDNTSGQTLTATGGVAERLGLFAKGEESVTNTTGNLQTEDRHTYEVDSVFNTLIRLRTALEEGNVPGIGEAIQRLDVDLDRATFANSETGSRLVTLETLKTRLEDEEVQVREALSLELDVDFVEAVSEYTARQASLQASLQVSATLLNTTILNYI